MENPSPYSSLRPGAKSLKTNGIIPAGFEEDQHLNPPQHSPDEPDGSF